MKTATVLIRFAAVSVFAVIIFSAGCQKITVQESLWDQLKELGQQKTTLQMRVDKLEEENKDLRTRIETLTAIGTDSRLDALAGLNRIEISRRSGFYDKDKDGTTETLIVYIKPTDTSGDIVKIPGSVKVQLWDLNTDDNNALLAEWETRPEELKNSWSNTLMTNYYRLTFQVADLIADKEKELTVKVGFVDYVTGRVIREQAVLEL